MFRFLELSLIGWDLWPPMRVKLDSDVVMIVGPNGSGKTTLLDAIRQLLDARLSSRRRLQHYLRRPDAPALVRAVVSNGDPSTGAQAFRRERITEPEVTLACALVPTGGPPEKRFAILPGRVPVEEIKRRLLESRDWLRPERYRRALEGAGVTRSLMSVLAIEQGRTNSLFELGPRELFTHVLDMLGDRSVLERYRDSRRRYEDSEREVGRQTEALTARQADLATALREVERLGRWEAARDRVDELKRRLPAAELQVLLRERREAEAKIPEFRTKVRRGDVEIARLSAELESAVAARDGARDAAAAAREAEGNAREALELAIKEEARASMIVDSLERKQAEVGAMTAGDADALGRAAEVADREYFRAEAALGEAEGRHADLVRKVEKLESGAPVLPGAVEAAIVEMERRGIHAVPLREKVEAAGPEGASAEAALGDARWCLVVDARDAAAALDVARECGFPGPVWSGDCAGERGQVGPIRFDAGVPIWLAGWASGVDLRADGSWRDGRGEWCQHPVERVLGEAGRRAALEAAVADRDRAAADVESARKAHGGAAASRISIRASLDTEIRRRRLLEEVAALPEARAAALAAGRGLAVTKEAYGEALRTREAADGDHFRLLQAARDAEAGFDGLKNRLEGERKALADMESRLAECDERTAVLEPSIGPDLRARAGRFELDGVDTVRADLVRAENDLVRMGDPPPAGTREEAAHLERSVLEMEVHVKARRAESERARAELAECRRRYLDVVGAALHGYRTRAEVIAGGASVRIEMDLPRLEDDDRALDEAGIAVGFGFDGKEPLPLGDPSFSGGQQVIAGLVLLMAMVETEGRGFFVLDEPFAHLSVDRIDEVGRFLRASGAQFILTAPTTLDRAQLDPASTVIMLRKKSPSEAHAPVPVVAEA